MILNLLVLAFVLGMAVMWSTYGLFSAMLHLLVVIISGALAFAFWELVVYALLLDFMPGYAWGLGLLGTFLILLIGLRQALDNLVRGNVKFPRLADQLLGGACGAMAGVLTTGIAVIAMGFLPLPVSMAGYQPYEVQSNGQVAPRPDSGLWIPVTDLTQGFYNRLSAGAFSPWSGSSLAGWLPDLAQQATVHRLARSYKGNDHQSLTVSPETVEATGLIRFDGEALPGVGGEVNDYINGNLNSAGGESSLAVVQTRWSKKEKTATFDSDGLLRVPPTQVRLHILDRQGQGQLLPPIGFSKPSANGNVEFFPITDNRIYASSLVPEQNIAWLFALPGGARPNFLLLRNTRVYLPEAAEGLEPLEVATAVGRMHDPEAEAQAIAAGPAGPMDITADPVGYTTHKAARIDITNALPLNASKNKAQAFNYNDDGVILSGEGTIGKGAGGRGNSVTSVFVSESLRPVRVQMAPHTPPAGGAAVGNQQEIRLTAGGFDYYPFAYVLQRSDGTQKAHVLDSGNFRNNTDLPLNEMSPDDKLFVYWAIRPGATVQSYRVGPAEQAIGYTVR